MTLSDTMDVARQTKYASLNALSFVEFDKMYMDEMVAEHNMDVAKVDSASKYANGANKAATLEETTHTLQYSI